MMELIIIIYDSEQHSKQYIAKKKLSWVACMEIKIVTLRVRQLIYVSFGAFSDIPLPLYSLTKTEREANRQTETEETTHRLRRE